MTEEVKALKTSLAESRTFREDVVSAERQTEQVQYALADKDNQLEEMSVLLARKQDEVKSLLRQLAAVGTVEAPLVCEKTEPTSFEVLFAMDGSLGLEFQQLRAPYIVAEVHQGVAAGLGIRPGWRSQQAASSSQKRSNTCSRMYLDDGVWMMAMVLGARRLEDWKVKDKNGGIDG